MGDGRAEDHQQQETEGKLQFHSRLTLMDHMFTSLKFCNLKVCTWGAYSILALLLQVGVSLLPLMIQSFLWDQT